MRASSQLALIYVVKANPAKTAFNLVAIKILDGEKLDQTNSEQSQDLAPFLKKAEAATQSSFFRDHGGVIFNTFNPQSSSLFIGVIACRSPLESSELAPGMEQIFDDTALSIPFADLTGGANPAQIISKAVLNGLELDSDYPRTSSKRSEGKPNNTVYLNLWHKQKKDGTPTKLLNAKFSREKDPAAHTTIDVTEKAAKNFGLLGLDEHVVNCKLINDLESQTTPSFCGLFKTHRSKKEFFDLVVRQALGDLSRAKPGVDPKKIGAPKNKKKASQYKKTECLSVLLHFHIVGREDTSFASDVRLLIGESAPSSSSEGSCLSIKITKERLEEFVRDGKSLLTLLHEFTEHHKNCPVYHLTLQDFVFNASIPRASAETEMEAGIDDAAAPSNPKKRLEEYITGNVFLNIIFDMLANEIIDEKNPEQSRVLKY